MKGASGEQADKRFLLIVLAAIAVMSMSVLLVHCGGGGAILPPLPATFSIS